MKAGRFSGEQIIRLLQQAECGAQSNQQGHRCVKRRVNPGLGCAAFCTAQRTMQGDEAMHRFRTGQFEGLAKEDVLAPNRLITQPFGLAV
jgi:hypothetical protein